MDVRVMQAGSGQVRETGRDDLSAPTDGWAWIDIAVDDADVDVLVEFTSSLELDPIAVHDAVTDFDLPKLDDFGSHLLAIIHGLSDDRIDSYEIDCFLTANRQLVTVHQADSPSIDTLWAQVPRHPELASGGADELLARLADVATRRFLSVLDVFDDRIDGMIEQALTAEASVVADVTAVRTDLGKVRRAVLPQREALDQLRSTPSPLLSDQARRRFSDVFDVSSRAAQGIDAARASLAETLDAYRGAEAREATEVGKVLTIYAAVMLPLSLIAGDRRRERLGDHCPDHVDHHAGVTRDVHGCRMDPSSDRSRCRCGARAGPDRGRPPPGAAREWRVPGLDKDPAPNPSRSR
jgi:magnesium transporter